MLFLQGELPLGNQKKLCRDNPATDTSKTKKASGALGTHLITPAALWGTESKAAYSSASSFQLLNKGIGSAANRIGFPSLNLLTAAQCMVVFLPGILLLESPVSHAAQIGCQHWLSFCFRLDIHRGPVSSQTSQLEDGLTSMKFEKTHKIDRKSHRKWRGACSHSTVWLFPQREMLKAWGDLKSKRLN